MEKLKLSVVISNYNDGENLKKNLPLILDQSLKADEIIILDNKSTDNSLDIIKEIARKNKNVKVLVNEENIGVTNSYNRGYKEARGEYILFASTNDKVFPGLFEKSVTMLEKYPQAGLSFSDIVALDYVNKKRIEVKYKYSKTPTYAPPKDIVKIIRKTTYISSTSVIIRKSAWDLKEIYLTKLKWYSDGFAFNVIALRHGACYIPEILSQFHVSKSSYSYKGTRNFEEQKKILDEMHRLLKSKSFKDVYLGFIKSNLIRMMITDYKIIFHMLAHPKYWKFNPIVLTLYCIKDFLREKFEQ